MKAPSRVLVLKPCCLGDVLMATPLARALKAAWPGAILEWAVDRHSRPMLLGNPQVDRLIDATGVIRGQFRVGAYLRLWRELRRGNHDAAFVPDRAPLLALLPWLAGIPMRVGLDSGGRGWCHTVRVTASLDIVKPETELYLDLARVVGVAPGSVRPVFEPSAEDRHEARQVMAQLEPGGRQRVIAIHPAGGVNPGMTLTEKRWPAKSYAELARRLLAEGLADRVVVLGGPDDASVCAAVLEGLNGPEGRVHDVAGRLSLGATGALISECRAFVGNDSGVAHLAMAVGTQAVVIFGPTDPRRYGPLGGMGVAVGPGSRGEAGGFGETGDSRVASDLRRAGGATAIRRVEVEAVLGALRAVLRSDAMG